jgi:hypothetical protein
VRHNMDDRRVLGSQHRDRQCQMCYRLANVHVEVRCAGGRPGFRSPSAP